MHGRIVHVGISQHSKSENEVSWRRKTFLENRRVARGECGASSRDRGTQCVTLWPSTASAASAPQAFHAPMHKMLLHSCSTGPAGTSSAEAPFRCPRGPGRFGVAEQDTAFSMRFLVNHLGYGRGCSLQAGMGMGKGDIARHCKAFPESLQLLKNWNVPVLCWACVSVPVKSCWLWRASLVLQGTG